MRDDDLRALEREAVAGGASERLRYLRALERVGRREDALELLLAVSEDSEVRRELARFPAWSAPASDGGGTRALDVPLLAERPHVEWGLENATGYRQPAEDALVEASRAIEARLRTSLASLRLAGDTLLGLDDRRHLVALDLASGTRCAATPIEQAAALETTSTRALVVTRTGLIAYPLEDSRQPLEPAWRFSWRQVRGLYGQPGVVATESLALLWGRLLPLVGLDARTGEVRFRIDLPGAIRLAPLVDAAGFAVALPDRVAAYDSDGQLSWEHPGDFRLDALTPDFVVARIDSRRDAGERFVFIDRASGRFAHSNEASVISAVRDGFYTLDALGTVQALSHDGVKKWSLPLPALTTAALRPYGSLVPAGRWLFATGAGGVCLKLG